MEEKGVQKPKEQASSLNVTFEDGQNKRKWFNINNWFFWFMGAVVSLLPVIVLNLVKLLKQETDATPFIVSVLGNPEIFFICTSLMLSAVFEIYSKNRPKLCALLMVCIVAYTLLYALTKGVILTAHALQTVSVATSISLFITLLLGSIAFIQKKG